MTVDPGLDRGLIPPIGSTRPRSEISPIIAVSMRTVRVVTSDVSAEAKREIAVGQFGLAKPEKHPGKGYLALESAVSNFEPANDTAGRHAAWTAQTDNGNHVGINGHFDGGSFDARKRDRDQNLGFGFHDLNRRLPKTSRTGSTLGWKNWRCNRSARTISSQAPVHINVLGSIAALRRVP
jgi:hypothetical protein